RGLGSSAGPPSGSAAPPAPPEPTLASAGAPPEPVAPPPPDVEPPVVIEPVVASPPPVVAEPVVPPADALDPAWPPGFGEPDWDALQPKIPNDKTTRRSAGRMVLRLESTSPVRTGGTHFREVR